MAYTAAMSIQRILHDLIIVLGNEESYLRHLYRMSASIRKIDFEENGIEGKHLEKKIRDLLWKAEDVIESYMLSHILLAEDTNEMSGKLSFHDSNFSKHLLEVIQEIESTKERMDKLADDLKHSQGLSIDPSTSDLPPVHKNKMIDHYGALESMKRSIIGDHLGLGAIEIYGMGGIGKTSLAISIYNDLEVRSYFSIGAWVEISLEHSVRSILLNLVHTMEFFDAGSMIKDVVNCTIIEKMNDKDLEKFLCEIFMDRRYLVIVDCLSDVNLDSWDYIKTILPDSKNGSRILLVSRMRVTSGLEFFLGHSIIGFLNGRQSWYLLRQHVFGDEPCPTVLERIGRRIAANCKGLPLAIITVGAHLAKEEKTVEYWNKVAESGNLIVYAANGAAMFERLGLSYIQMPRCFRAIFLYMGAFPESQKMSVVELQRFWVAEVLLDWNEFDSPQNMLSELSEYFLDRDLLIDIRKHDIEMFTWSLHHALWHFCCNQAKREEFFHVFDEYINEGDDSEINSKLRRLVIRKAVLFGITEFIEKIEHSELSIRSVLFTGPYHPYPVTKILWSSYKMLRVLHADSICLYEFPAEILYLKLLRYLSLTLNGGDIPPGISKLRNLESLIVRFHHIVRSCEGSALYLPMEIWEMQKLAHLQVVGYDLPVPAQADALLPNLTTLLDVGPHSCTKEVLGRIRNLIRLEIGINLAPERNSALMCLFNHSVPLENLRAASFVITNPYFEDNPGSTVVPMSESFLFSMINLKELSFHGCGFPWESIETVSQLPCLLKLELRSHSFRGPKWELTSTGFSRLQHLILEDLDLVYWTTRSGDHFFPCLRTVTIMKCHKLEQFPLNFDHCRDLITVIALDCSHATEIWAQSIHMKLPETQKRRKSLMVLSLRGESFYNFQKPVQTRG